MGIVKVDYNATQLQILLAIVENAPMIVIVQAKNAGGFNVWIAFMVEIAELIFLVQIKSVDALKTSTVTLQPQYVIHNPKFAKNAPKIRIVLVESLKNYVIVMDLVDNALVIKIVQVIRSLVMLVVYVLNVRVIVIAKVENSVQIHNVGSVFQMRNVQGLIKYVMLDKINVLNV